MAEDQLRALPSSAEAERAVIGAVLTASNTVNGENILDVCLARGINEDTFFDVRHRTVFAMAVEMSRQMKPIDPISVQIELRNAGKLEAAGGSPYLQSIVERSFSTAGAEYYMQVLEGKHLRRAMIDRANRIASKAFDESGSPDPKAILGEAESVFLELGQGGHKTTSWDQAVKEVGRKILAILNRPADHNRVLEGLSTGLTLLDEKLQGLKPSEMIVIAARPSVGKTSLAMNIAESCATGQYLTPKNGCYVPIPYDNGKAHPVMIFSLEMPVAALTKRMLAGRAAVNMWRVNRDLLPKAQRLEAIDRIGQTADQLERAPIYVDDTAGLDIMDLRARARRAKKMYGIELIVIDYLQLCRAERAAKQGRQLEVSEISQQVKAMAKELKIPVIVLSQLSRANEKRTDQFEKPKLSDLRDSGAIEQDADVVFLLRRPSRTANDPKRNDEALAIIDVAKNRNGETGEVEVDFIREYTRFMDRPLQMKEQEGMQSTMPPETSPKFVEDPMI